MATTDKQIGDVLGREQWLEFTRRAVAEGNPLMQGPQDERVFPLASALADRLQADVSKLPRWAYQSVTQVMEGNLPDNLNHSIDASRFDTHKIEYMTDMIDAISKGEATPADRGLAENFFYEKNPSFQAERNAEKLGINTEKTAEERAKLDANKQKLAAEVRKQQQAAAKKAAKAQKKELAYEQKVQKADAKINAKIEKLQVKHERARDAYDLAKQQFLVKGPDGKLRAKEGLTERERKQFMAAQKAASDAKKALATTSEKAAAQVKKLYDQGKVSEHYFKYRSSQLETGDLSVKVAQTFQRQEWSKAMLERAGFDKLAPAEQQAKIEEARKKVAEAEQNKRMQPKQEPERKKVPADDLGLGKKETAKSKDVAKQAPTREQTRTK